MLRKIKLPEEIEEGWGITNDEDNNLIISDGTDKLYFVKPNQNITSIEITNKIQVKFGSFIYFYINNHSIKIFL